MSRSCADLPPNVKALFPKENLEFAAGITCDEAAVLKDVFSDHDCFEQVGEMIDAVNSKDAALGAKMQGVLDKNCSRLQGLSPAAVEHSKKVIQYVTHVQCGLTLGKDFCPKKAQQLKEEFEALPENDREALKKNNPDMTF